MPALARRVRGQRQPFCRSSRRLSSQRGAPPVIKTRGAPLLVAEKCTSGRCLPPAPPASPEAATSPSGAGQRPEPLPPHPSCRPRHPPELPGLQPPTRPRPGSFPPRSGRQSVALTASPPLAGLLATLPPGGGGGASLPGSARFPAPQPRGGQCSGSAWSAEPARPGRPDTAAARQSPAAAATSPASAEEPGSGGHVKRRRRQAGACQACGRRGERALPRRAPSPGLG